MSKFIDEEWTCKTLKRIKKKRQNTYLKKNIKTIRIALPHKTANWKTPTRRGCEPGPGVRGRGGSLAAEPRSLALLYIFLYGTRARARSLIAHSSHSFGPGAPPTRPRAPLRPRPRPAGGRGRRRRVSTAPHIRLRNCGRDNIFGTINSVNNALKPPLGLGWGWWVVGGDGGAVSQLIIISDVLRPSWIRYVWGLVRGLLIWYFLSEWLLANVKSGWMMDGWNRIVYCNNSSNLSFEYKNYAWSIKGNYFLSNNENDFHILDKNFIRIIIN